QIPTRTGRQRDEQIKLGEELKVVSALCRGGLHKILIVGIQASALENIKHIVHVEFREMERGYGSCQVGVTMVIKVFALQHATHIRVAAGAQQIVHSAALGVLTVVAQ